MRPSTALPPSLLRVNQYLPRTCTIVSQCQVIALQLDVFHPQSFPLLYSHLTGYKGPNQSLFGIGLIQPQLVAVAAFVLHHPSHALFLLGPASYPSRKDVVFLKLDIHSPLISRSEYLEPSLIHLALCETSTPLPQCIYMSSN